MGALYPDWLADAARLTGAPVVEVAGWRTRGHTGMRVVEGVVAHHTAGPRTGNYPSLNVVTNGRVGLAGPLSAFGLGRDGTIYVIAAGISYHAGASRYAGFTDLNDEFYGIEAESAGTLDDWTAEQRDIYPRLVAAILYYIRRDASRVAGHKECALPIGRKPDPAFMDMNVFRSRVAYLLGDPLGRIPKFAPQPNKPAPTKVKPMLIDRPFPAGDSYHRIIAPTGTKSGLYGRGWISISAGGGVEFRVGFQQSANSDGYAPGAREMWAAKIPNAARPWTPFTETEFLEVWIVGAEGPGAICVELEPK